MTIILNYIQDSLPPEENQVTLKELAAPRQLEWVLSPSIDQALEKALQNYQTLTADLDFKLLHFRCETQYKQHLMIHMVTYV